MADATTTETAAAETSGDSETTEAAATEATSTEATTEGESALGDAGKKALDAMKAKWKTEADERKKLSAEFDAFKAKAEGKEAEFTAAQERAATEKAALDKANAVIRKARVELASKGVLADPKDAYKFLDLDQFEVDNDGNVDEKAIADALAELIKTKPYLGAQSGQRFQGSADGGARNGSQVSIDDQIAEATKAGNHQLAIALKQQRSSELAAKKS